MTTSEIARSIRAHLELGQRQVTFFELTSSQIEILMGAGYRLEKPETGGDFTTVMLGD